jgi:hypothetical protein
VIAQNLGQHYVAVFYLLVLLIVALIRVRQIHLRGQTNSEAWAARQAERRQKEARRQQARQAAAALPWLNDDRLGPADEPGVLIAPARAVVGLPSRLTGAP